MGLPSIPEEPSLDPDAARSFTAQAMINFSTAREFAADPSTTVFSGDFVENQIAVVTVRRAPEPASGTRSDPRKALVSADLLR